MTTPSTRRELNLADYLAIARRYKWLIIVTAILVPAVAYGVSIQQPKVFSASSDVLLSRQDLGSVITGIQTPDTVTDSDRFLRTQAALARVPAVLQGAIEKADIDGVDAAALLFSSSVTPRESTDLLTFSVRSRDDTVAVELATAYATAFTSYKLKMDTANVSRARRELQGRLTELRRTTGSETEVYRQLLQKFQDLRTLELLQSPATVVRPAVAADQVEPRPKRNAALGLMLGLMLGIGAAFLLTALDRRIRDPEEVERQLQVPLLAKLPDPRGRVSTLTILDRPPDAVTEAIGRLRTSFDFANADLRAKMVLATSAAAQEGKSTTIANLAIALSRTGRHVVLVDLDLRRPSLARLFHLGDTPGVTDAATRNAKLVDTLTRVAHAPPRSRLMALGELQTTGGMLEVMSAGRTNVDPGEFVESAELADLLQKLRNRAEIVLVDAPPILAAGDAMALTGKVDAVLLVSRVGTLTPPALRELARALDRSPAPLLGFVATGAKIEEGYLTYLAEEKRHQIETVPRSVEDHPSTAQEVSETRSASASSAGSGRWSPRRSGG